MNTSVVIIGAGLSGALTAIHLLQLSSTTPLTIHLIDRRGTFGPGLAYSPPSDRFKLNVRAKAMGAFPEDPGGFFRWLTARDSGASPEDFVPRLKYGEYLTDLVERAASSPGANKLVRVADEATDITYRSSTAQFTVQLLSGNTIEADACVLALGNLMQTSLKGVSTPEMFRPPFVRSSYDGLTERTRMLVIGSSLTAVDVILEAEGRGFTGHYTVLSRNGRLPLAHETFSPQPSVSLPEGWESLASSSKLLRLLRKESRRLGSSQPVFDAIRPRIQTMWRNLPLAEQKRFLRHIRPFWEIHRHRIPAEHATKLRALQESGRLTIIAGRIVETHTSPSAISVTMTPRGARKIPITRDFDVAFLCAGAEGDLMKSNNPLIQKLLAKGLISAGPLKLGSTPPPPLDNNNAPPLWVIGPLQREDRWEITAARELREEAMTIARTINTRISQKSA